MSSLRTRNLSPFETFAEWVKRCTGIVLSVEKQALVEARLKPFLDRSEHEELEGYLNHLLRSAPEGERGEVLDALTTNTTAFYREIHHFDLLSEVIIPDRAVYIRSGEPLTVWSAACSTGEEPYTLAIELYRMRQAGKLHDFRVLATDLSAEALERARAGCYLKGQLQELPRPLLDLAFDPCRVAGRPGGRVKPAIRSKVSFHPLNLIAKPWRLRRRFDLIFCRNVLIYFDESTRTEVVERLVAQLQPGGFLVLGHSDNALKHGVAVEAVGPTAYRKLSG